MHINLICHDNSSYMFRPTRAILGEKVDTEKTFSMQYVVVGGHKVI